MRWVTGRRVSRHKLFNRSGCFCPGPSGVSVRGIIERSGAEIQSWTQPLSPLDPKKVRLFVVQVRGKDNKASLQCQRFRLGITITRNYPDQQTTCRRSNICAVDVNWFFELKNVCVHSLIIVYIQGALLSATSCSKVLYGGQR